MGRPVNKSFFGDPTNPGKQITINANLSGTVEACFIEEQKGNGVYNVIAVNSTNEGRVRLVNNTSPNLGEGYIEVVPFGGGATELARIIQQFVVKTFEGNVYKWDRTRQPIQFGEADLTDYS